MVLKVKTVKCVNLKLRPTFQGFVAAQFAVSHSRRVALPQKPLIPAALLCPLERASECCKNKTSTKTNALGWPCQLENEAKTNNDSLLS